MFTTWLHRHSRKKVSIGVFLSTAGDFLVAMWAVGIIENQIRTLSLGSLSNLQIFDIQE